MQILGNSIKLYWFLGIFFVTTALIMLTSDLPSFSIPINTFQKDFMLLQEYESGNKKYNGGLIVSEKFKEYNSIYGNIFGFHETARTSDGLMAPYRSIGRVFFKMPIFLISGPDIFPIIWRITGLIIGIGVFLIIIGKTHSHIKILIFLACIFFSPVQLFDQEFIFLYAQSMMLFLYLSRNKNGYLILCFIFGLYAISARIEFIYFSTFINLYLALHWIQKKKYRNLLFIIIIYALFATGYLLSNKNYFGGYLTNSYIATLGDESTIRNEYGQIKYIQKNITAQITERLIKIVFPSGLNLARVTSSILYILQSYIGIGFIIFLFRKPKSKNNRIYLLSKKYGIFIFFIVIYSLIFYGSKGVANMPNGSGNFFYNIGNSSYARYFGVFIFLLWTLLYSRLLIPGKVAKILFSTGLIIFIIQGPYYSGMLKSAPGKSNSNQEKIIPSGSTILARIPPIRLMFSNYKILFPSGEDYGDYIIYISAGSAAWLAVGRPNTKESNAYLDRLTYYPKQHSAFLEKIGFYVYKSREPVYILTNTYTSDIEKDRTLNFFRSKNGLILRNHTNKIIKLEADKNFFGEYIYIDNPLD